MLKPSQVYGVIPALVTPFDAKEELNLESLRRITRHVIDNGAHALMTTGGNGEFPHLTREEKQLVIRTVVDETRGRIPVIAGTAACSTREAIALGEDARRAGADALIVTPPYYFRLPDDALYQFYRDLAANAVLPVIIYNNPLYTGNSLSPALIARLAEIPGIIGLKQSQSDQGQLIEVLRLIGDKISVCTGIDSQFYSALCVGARGVFSTAACVVPRQLVELYDATQAGRHAEAKAMHLRLQMLNRFLEYDPGYVAPCKDGLNMLGLNAGNVRAPFANVTPEEHEELHRVLLNLGLM
ncbi:MAG: 4-hydroxy-tetrahydrodipicolinate synthase [Chloroflexi bacterium]|nr:4-hydroxy-tetrahydrodipicolinate synthase [Chloroflexota bacterium]